MPIKQENKEIFARHPELMELREFKTDEEIVQALKNGCAVWRTESRYGAPTDIAESPIKVEGVGVYDDESSSLHGIPVYYYYRQSSLAGSPVKENGSIRDFHGMSANAAFTSRERAEAYFAAAQKAYESDPKWQAEVEREEEFNRSFPF